MWVNSQSVCANVIWWLQNYDKRHKWNEMKWKSGNWIQPSLHGDNRSVELLATVGVHVSSTSILNVVCHLLYLTAYLEIWSEKSTFSLTITTFSRRRRRSFVPIIWRILCILYILDNNNKPKRCQLNWARGRRANQEMKLKQQQKINGREQRKAKRGPIRCTHRNTNTRTHASTLLRVDKCEW